MGKGKERGKVIKGIKGRFLVLCRGEIVSCVARGRLLISDKICVGDDVNFVKDKGMFIIEDILPRKNRLIRPPVCNVDMLVIVVAPLPLVDWGLVDKLLIFAAEYNIKPILCYNKIDLNQTQLVYANKVYKDIADIVGVSALTKEGIGDLEGLLSGVVCFAGQSAVGKTSLLNIFCNTEKKVGDLSKLEQGKHTTRHVEIVPLNEKVMLVDTCGFSLLDLEGIKSKELMLYYPDFMKQKACKYNMCTHINEPDCEVKKAVEEGLLDKDRYLRYVAIYEELKEGEYYG